MLHFRSVAGVAELADAQDSGSCGVKPVEVRFLSPAFSCSDFRFESSHLIYLDNNATTQPDDAVVEAMSKALRENWANPSSTHDFGKAARHAVEEARNEVAELVGGSAREIIFTSGGTESCNLAIAGSLGGSEGRSLIVTTRVEHSAGRECALALAGKDGKPSPATRPEVVWLETVGGVVDLQECERLLHARSGEIAIVSVMWANNETGVIQPVEKIAVLCRRFGVRFHSDATQWIGRMPTCLGASEIDLLTLSAHKFHGPKGVGALFCRRGTTLQPLLVGGGQERERRAGTENVPGIVGLGVAARLARRWLSDASDAVKECAAGRDEFESHVCARLPGAVVLGREHQRIWSTSNIAFTNLQSEAIVVALSAAGVCASAGAACSTGSLDPSPVLLAMGVSPQQAHGAVRFSFSRQTTRDEVTAAVGIIAEVVGRLSRSLP